MFCTDSAIVQKLCCFAVFVVMAPDLIYSKLTKNKLVTHNRKILCNSKDNKVCRSICLNILFQQVTNTRGVVQSVSIPNLVSDTLYSVAVKAVGPGGHSAKATDSFRTLVCSDNISVTS